MATDRNFTAVIGDGLDGATTGVKLSLTASGSAKIDGIYVLVNSGTPTIAVEFVRGATVVQLHTASASFSLQPAGIVLEDGDVIRLNVTTLSAGSTFDAGIFAE